MSREPQPEAELEQALAQLLAPAAPGDWTPRAGLAAVMRRDAVDPADGALALALGPEAMRGATRAAVTLAAAVATSAALLAGTVKPTPAAAPAWLRSDLVQLAAAPAPQGETP